MTVRLQWPCQKLVSSMDAGLLAYTLHSICLFAYVFMLVPCCVSNRDFVVRFEVRFCDFTACYLLG